MTNFRLTLDEQQAHIVTAALDCYSRVLAGQLDAIPDWHLAEGSRELLEQVARLNSPHNFRESTNSTVRDIYEVIRHAVAWNKAPKGGVTLEFDPPMHWNKQVELPVIEVGKLNNWKIVRPKQPVQLAKELTELIGTSDIEEAVEIIKELKHKLLVYETVGKYSHLPTSSEQFAQTKERDD